MCRRMGVRAGLTGQSAASLLKRMIVVAYTGLTLSLLETEHNDKVSEWQEPSHSRLRS